MRKEINFIDIGTRFVAILIFGFSAYLKFSGAAHQIELFTRIGAEPYGRLAVGALECLVVVLLIFPMTARRGAILGFLMMLGAIFTMSLFHENGEGGKLFAAAIVVLFCCIGILLNRQNMFTTELS